MLSYPKGTRYTVQTPIIPREGRSEAEQIEMDMKQGFTRLEVNGEMVRMEIINIILPIRYTCWWTV